VAVARDSDGKQTFSSVARVVAGARNLAFNKRATTSSGPKARPELAVDGDLFQGWNGDKQDQQWLAIDLGEEQTISAATLTWSKAYAGAYTFQVSSDGTEWREVFKQTKKTGYAGNTDLIRFAPVKCRHVRLLCTERGTDWGGYNVYELCVYPALP